MGIPIFSLEGKVAVVTGSSRGIGRTLALGFAEAGASLVIVARSVTELENTAEEIRAHGGNALSVPTDVTNSDQVSEMVRSSLKKFERIDVLVNCAGGGAIAPLLDISEQAWDEMIALNLKSVYLCSRAVGRVMVDQKSGSIINFSSGAAKAILPEHSHYCASKAGVNQFTRVLAVEWGRFNVRVNAISPGLTETPLTRDTDPVLLEQWSKAIPLGRIGQPEDILGTAIFLASEASAYISGAIIPVAGGPQ